MLSTNTRRKLVVRETSTYIAQTCMGKINKYMISKSAVERAGAVVDLPGAEPTPPPIVLRPDLLLDFSLKRL